MRRRTFLASLVALPAALKAVALKPTQEPLSPYWAQTTQLSRHRSPEYQEAFRLMMEEMSLTQATFREITTSDLEEQTAKEIEYAKTLRNPSLSQKLTSFSDKNPV